MSPVAMSSATIASDRSVAGVDVFSPVPLTDATNTVSAVTTGCERASAASGRPNAQTLA